MVRTAQCTMLLKRIKRLLLLLLLAVLGCADVIKLAPCTNSMLVGMYRDPNVTFASTMLRGGQPPPQLVFADRQRESDALNALLANADPTAINGSFPPITMFISDNTGFVRSLSDAQRSYPSVQDILEQLSGPWHISVALYNILPQGAFSPEQLLSLERVQTALGMILDRPYELAFTRLESNDVVVSNNGLEAKILYSRVACDGVLHVTSTLLFPGSLTTPFPEVNASLYDIDQQELLQLQWSTGPSANPLPMPKPPLAPLPTTTTPTTAPAPPPPPPPTISQSSLPAGTIVGIAIAAAAVAALVVVAGVCALPRVRRAAARWRGAHGAPQRLMSDPGHGGLGGGMGGKASGRRQGGLEEDGKGVMMTNNSTKLDSQGNEYLSSSILASQPGMAQSLLHRMMRRASYKVPDPEPIRQGGPGDNKQGGPGDNGSSDKDTCPSKGVDRGLDACADDRTQEQQDVFHMQGRPPVPCSGLASTQGGTQGGTTQAGTKEQQYDHPVQHTSTTRGPGGACTPRGLLPGLEDVNIPTHRLEICRMPDGSPEVLGSGGYGVVYRGVYDGRVPVAVKLAPNTIGASYEDKHYKQLLQEIKLMRSFDCAHLVGFIGVAVEADCVMLVTEFMEGGDLFQGLHGPERDRYTWNAMGRHIALDVARGLEYLHARNIIHLDLKSPNILLGQHGIAKIADLGLSKVVSKGFLSQVTQAGTFNWASPELILNDEITCAADIYAFGIILYEIITGQVPTRGIVKLETLKDKCPPEVAALVGACLQQQPCLRPSARECVQRLEELVGPPPTHEDGPASPSVTSFHDAAASPPPSGGSSM